MSALLKFEREQVKLGLRPPLPCDVGIRRRWGTAKNHKGNISYQPILGLTDAEMAFLDVVPRKWCRTVEMPSTGCSQERYVMLRKFLIRGLAERRKNETRHGFEWRRVNAP